MHDKHNRILSLWLSVLIKISFMYEKFSKCVFVVLKVQIQMATDKVSAAKHV